MPLTALRLTRVAIHLALGLGLVLTFRFLSLAVRHAIIGWWARRLLAAIGVRLRVSGAPSAETGLVVANHVSWLDVVAIAAVRPTTFVCKSELAKWPGIGGLLRGTGMIFLRRGSIRDVWRVNLRLRASFMAGQSVAAFPEGTTTEGRDVLAFRTALFQPAVERDLPVHPIAIAYSSGDAAYVNEMSFLDSLLRVAHARNLEVHLAMLGPIETQGLARRAAAARARSLILARVTCVLSSAREDGLEHQALAAGAGGVARRRMRDAHERRAFARRAHRGDLRREPQLRSSVRTLPRR